MARRFAGSKIRELELEGGHDDEVLALSLRHEVLSSKAAWLVLENDEAYRSHEIERKHPSDPPVTGKDLEGGDQNAIGGEGPEPELWLIAGLLMAVAFVLRRRFAQ